jgi:pyrimidine-nucleoside phosphorylase
MTTWDARETIAAKREGQEVPPDEIERLVQGYALGEVADAPMAAFLMACLIRGMFPSETRAMTRAFIASGQTLDLGGLDRPVVDKHSTGGVSDGVSLVFVPLVASLGLACAKLSGRGLGHTGGTIDKLESIPGFRTDLSPDEVRSQATDVGCVIGAQTPGLVPADGAVYALRDATATVPSIPLIAASVMSKKLAVTSDLTVLDVKTGSGAFMVDTESAWRLAETCLELADAWGRQAIAAITDMSQPLGDGIGNAIEVAEAIEVLAGSRRGRLWELATWLAAHAVAAALGPSLDDALARARAAIEDGSALERFRWMVEAQGGDARVVEDPARVLPAAPIRKGIVADRAGVVTSIETAAVGGAAVVLGAGRARKGEHIDPAVGIVLRAKIGDAIQAGDEIGEVCARDDSTADEAIRRVLAAITLGDEPVDAPPLVHALLEGSRMER